MEPGLQVSHDGTLARSFQAFGPQVFWTYGSESFMGLMSHLANACLSGTPAHKVPETVLFKYRTFWHLLLMGLLVLDEPS